MCPCTFNLFQDGWRRKFLTAKKPPFFSFSLSFRLELEHKNCARGETKRKENSLIFKALRNFFRLGSILFSRVEPRKWKKGVEILHSRLTCIMGKKPVQKGRKNDLVSHFMHTLYTHIYTRVCMCERANWLWAIYCLQRYRAIGTIYMSI